MVMFKKKNNLYWKIVQKTSIIVLYCGTNCE